MKTIDQLWEKEAIAVTCLIDRERLVVLLNDRDMTRSHWGQYLLENRKQRENDEWLEFCPNSGSICNQSHFSKSQWYKLYGVDEFLKEESATESFRKFDTWATRDSWQGKLEYSNYINPLCDFSFAEYMKSKQIIWWEYRSWDNWQKWIPYKSLFEWLVRHTEILKLLYAWHHVVEHKFKWDTNLQVLRNSSEVDWFILSLHWKEGVSDIQIKTIETELNAIRFNGEGMKLQEIKWDFITS